MLVILFVVILLIVFGIVFKEDIKNFFDTKKAPPAVKSKKFKATVRKGVTLKTYNSPNELVQGFIKGDVSKSEFSRIMHIDIEPKPVDAEGKVVDKSILDTLKSLIKDKYFSTTNKGEI